MTLQFDDVTVKTIYSLYCLLRLTLTGRYCSSFNKEVNIDWNIKLTKREKLCEASDTKTIEQFVSYILICGSILTCGTLNNLPAILKVFSGD